MSDSHKYPVGALVEFNHGPRLWVVYQVRDCDYAQTPLYCLSFNAFDTKIECAGFYNRSWVTGISEAALTFIRMLNAPLADEVRDEYHHADLNNPRFSRAGVDEGRSERTSDEAPYRVDGKDSSTSIVEYARNLPKTHLLSSLSGGLSRTACGIDDSFTFTINLETVDCPECVKIIEVAKAREETFEERHATHLR
jgi:hypothetical protein